MKCKSLLSSLVLLTACLVLLCGCTSVSESNEQKIEEVVFPKDEVIDVRITINEDDYQEILDQPMEKEYKPADVEYNGYKITNVGIRTKGNSSLMGVARSDSERYSLKIAFDEYISSQNLFGLTKINLNNSFSDPTFIREFLSYELLSEMGVPTPQFSYVNVYINDELAGLFLAVEQIDEAFLSQNFETTHGALYKPDGQGSSLVWLGEDIEQYSGLNQKSKSSSDDIILDLIDELNNGTEVEKILNVDGVLRYLAVNTALANMDSYQGNFQHNYYLYEDEGVFSLIPWDYNMSFGGFGGSKESLIEMLIDEPTMGAVSNYPLVEKLLQNEEYKETYHAYLTEIVEGYLAQNSFEKRVQELVELIDPYVQQDPTKFYTYEEFSQSLTDDVQNIPGLLSFVEARVENLAQQLDGTLPTYSNGEGIKSSMGGMGLAMGRGQGANQGGQNAGAPRNVPDSAEEDQANQNRQNFEGGEMGEGRLNVEGDWPSNPREEMPNPGEGIPNFGGEMPNFGEGMPNFDKEAPNFGGERPNFGEGMPEGGNGPFGIRGQTTSQTAGNYTSEAIATGILLIILVLAIIFVFNFRKRSV